MAIRQTGSAANEGFMLCGNFLRDSGNTTGLTSGFLCFTATAKFSRLRELTLTLLYALLDTMGVTSYVLVPKGNYQFRGIPFFYYPYYCKDTRCQHHRRRSPLLCHGACQRYPDHQVLRFEQPEHRRPIETVHACLQSGPARTSKGIIHRDLKPSNILVTLYDGHPVPNVIDFGLAKALQHQSKLTDKTLFTEFGQVSAHCNT